MQELDSANLIKLKRDGREKGRQYASGSKQKRDLKYEDINSSLTIYLEALFTTIVIGTYKVRDTGTFDVPGVYLNAELTKKNIYD